MFRVFLALIVAGFCAPPQLLAQTVTLGGSLNVASADDFATRSFQDPWDMNERTDFGWHLNGVDDPQSQLTNVSFGGGVFSATASGVESNVFLLETSIIGSAPLGKIGTNHPIDANFYRVLAIHMNVSAPAQVRLLWFRDSIYDGTTTYSGTFAVSPGWRIYLVSVPGLGLGAGSVNWSGLIKSLQLAILPPGGAPVTWQIDWVRLVNPDSAVCRQVTWSGLGSSVDLYIDPDTANNGNESLLEDGVVNNTASGGCAVAGSGYNFQAGGLAPGNYHVLARTAGSGSGGVRTAMFTVNAIPTLTLTAPSEEGSADDFATTVLGNPWDMNALSDVSAFFNVAGQQIAPVAVETPAGTPLGNLPMLWAQNSGPAPSDPIVGLVFFNNVRIDPVRYRVLTVEFGLHNLARSIAVGSVARIGWKVAGSTDSISDDIIVNSRAGANVLQKLILDMADRSALPIETGSALGWVPGTSSNPGVDRFRFDVHEFPTGVPFFIRRVKLASFERVAPGGSYTIRWTASESSGTVTAYYDTDTNPASGLTLIGSAPTSQGALAWTAPNVGGSPSYFIHLRIDDGQGNISTVYSRWPVIVGAGFPPALTTPTNFRIVR
jgi:hypothetical protein